MVDGITSVGLGYGALEKFCIATDLPVMTARTFQQHLQSLSQEAHKLEVQVLDEAREKIRNAHVAIHPELQDQAVIDITVTFDGTWQKRGHQSMYGIGIAIDVVTGLVIDFEILSKYCQMCIVARVELGEDSPDFALWLEGHKSSKECNQNFIGASGSMEVLAAEKIWSRSIEKNQMRFTTLVSDGDARTWLRLREIAPYGDTRIEKEECVNHVAKRLGTALRKLSQDKKLGGKAIGALTVTKIDTLTSYYRRGIVEHLDDIEGMKRAIYATLHHASSTDARPQHTYCPTGRESWCFYNRATARQEEPGRHKDMKLILNEEVIENLRPVYERLTSDELLLRCARGKTQNANECLNSLIWRKCVKEVFVSKKRLHLAVVSAVAEYNNGIEKTKTMKAALRGEEAGPSGQIISRRRDKKRKLAGEAEAVQNRRDGRSKQKDQKKMNTKARGAKQAKDYAAGEF